MLRRALALTFLFWALPAVAAADIPILGQVLGTDGDPRAKVEVRLEPVPPTYERAALRLEGKPGPDPAATTRTGADGTFELSAPEAGMWKVVVSAPKTLTLEYRLIPLVDIAVLPAVQLVPSADLEVRMVDARGKAKSGAVGAVPLGRRSSLWRPQLRLATTGEDGAARLPLGKDEKIQLEVLATGHPLAIFEVYDETSITIDVPDGVAGTVRITDQQKRPLAGALAFQGSALLPLGLSDEEGHLPLVIQAEDPPSVKVSTANRWNGSFELDFSTASGNSKVKDLKLDPPMTLSGRVLDLSNREPVAGALVWAVRGELAVTDKQGHYALEDGVYKSRTVQAAASGYLAGFSQREEASESEVKAIGLTPASALSGKVVDRDGALLAGVEIEVAVLPQSGNFPPAVYRMMREGWRGRTSDRGVFEVTGLPAGVGYRLDFKLRGFAPHAVEVPILEASEKRPDLRVVLEPGRLAIGQVIDENDVPVVGAKVLLEEPPPSGDPMATMQMMRWRQRLEEEKSYLTDGEGFFEIADLAAGRYDLEILASGFAPARVPGVQVSQEDRRADFGTIVLVPGAAIEGKVTDPDGTAIADAEIWIHKRQQGFIGFRLAEQQKAAAKTDERGYFVVEDLLPGQPVTLAVSKEGFASEAVTNLQLPPEEPLAIVRQPAARLKGQVVDQQGDPIKDAQVMANLDFRMMVSDGAAMRRQRPAHAKTDADGNFAIEDVQPGTLQVRVQASGYQQKVQSGVELPAGGEREIDFVLEEGAVVEGTVTTADGEPVAQASITVSEPMERFAMHNVTSASGQTDIEGRYRVTGAPIGPGMISVHREHGQELQKNLDVKAGTNVVDLVLERGFEISGQVVDPDGNPQAGATLMLQQTLEQGMMAYFGGGETQTTSGGDGTFTLKRVKAGKYMVTATREGFAPGHAKDLEVSSDVSGVLIELSDGATLKGRVIGLDFDELGTLALAGFSQNGGMRQGRVDFEGEYVFDNLAPGQWHISAQVSSSGRSATLQVELPDGVPEVVEDIEFGTGFVLSGIVLDGGEPLAGANIAASSTTGTSGQGATGVDGRFRIENLKAGSYQFMVLSSAGIQHSETLELVEDRELRIELATGSVTGFVRDNQGKPVAGAAVRLEQLDSTDLMSQMRFAFGNRSESDSRGFFLVPKVRQGTWRVIATRSGYSPGETTIAVAGGSSPEIEIRLTPTEGVEFEVVLASGATLSTVQVTQLDGSGQALTSGNHPVIEGKVRVLTVPPGTWELAVQGGNSASTRFVVNAPGDQGTLVLPIGGSLNITVPELEDVPMSRVNLTGPDGKPYISSMGVMFTPGGWLLNGGKTTVSGLTPGVWYFSIEHEGRSWSGSATVTSGGTAEVTLP